MKPLEPLVFLTIRIPRALRSAAVDEAAERKTTVSELVRGLLARAMKHRFPDGPPPVAHPGRPPAEKKSG